MGDFKTMSGNSFTEIETTQKRLREETETRQEIFLSKLSGLKLPVSKELQHQERAEHTRLNLFSASSR
ncbi:hypothetical protein SAY87_020050 [Trapa incisa]|uniref:Uncharacterized protein n=1 Tax=Trapa incisa TaxID=236973 RepID=A0AAN7Q3Y6_9MYRT|nr:hypothetical protein SAY87_020050 [Trapa incisa]